MIVMLHKVLKFLISGVILGLLTSACFAGSNPYAQYTDQNISSQSNATFNPYTAASASASNDNNTTQSQKNQQSNAAALPVQPQTTGDATSVPVSSSMPTIQYSTPTALVQPANNVGQFSNTSSAATTKSTPYTFVNSQSNINNSSKSPPIFVPGLLPASTATPSAPSAGTNSTLIQVLESINQGVQLSNQQIANQIDLKKIANADFQPTSRDFISTLSGYVNLSGLYHSTMGLPGLLKHYPMTSGFGNGNAFDSGNYINNLRLVASHAMQIWMPSVHYGLNNVGVLYAKTGSNPSVMTQLKQSVEAPFNNMWMAQLKVASTPQLLRIIAIQNAENNYMTYQLLKRGNEQEMMQATQLAMLDQLNQSILQASAENVKNQANITHQLTILAQEMKGGH